MKTNLLQVEGISSNELIAEMRQQFGEVARLISPDMLITRKRAALIAEVDEITIWRWLSTGKLKNHAKENQNPRISLYQLLNLIEK